MFKDLPEGQTHYENDSCGEPRHNKNTQNKGIRKTCLNINCPERKGGECNAEENIQKGKEELLKEQKLKI